MSYGGKMERDSFFQRNEAWYSYWNNQLTQLKNRDNIPVEEIVQFDFSRIESMPEENGFRADFIQELFKSYKHTREENVRQDMELIPRLSINAVRIIWPYLTLRQIANLTDEQIARFDFSKLASKNSFSYFYNMDLIKAIFISEGQVNEKKLDLLNEENRAHVFHLLSLHFLHELDEFKKKHGIPLEESDEDIDPVKDQTDTRNHGIQRIKEISNKLLGGEES